MYLPERSDELQIEPCELLDVGLLGGILGDVHCVPAPHASLATHSQGTLYPVGCPC